MAKIEKSELERIIAAMKKRSEADHFPIEVIDPKQRADRQKELRKELEPIFTSAGLDLRKIDAVLQKHQAESLRDLEKGKVKATQRISRSRESLRLGIELQQSALNQATNLGVLPSIPINIATPFLIWTKPLEILVDSQINAGDNWAKIKATWLNSSLDRVSFYYLWDNPTNFFALVNVTSSIVANGLADVVGNTGIFSGGSASLYGVAEMKLFGWPEEGGTQAVDAFIVSLSANGSGFWSLETGEVDSAAVSGVFDLQRNFWAVPPGARAIFEIAMSLTSTVSDGYTSYDFANNVADFKVGCPSLTVNLLTAPPNVVAVG